MKARSGPLSFAISDREQAKSLFFLGYKVSEIAAQTGLSESRIYSWKTQGQWDQARPSTRCAHTLEQRYQLLIQRDPKTEADWVEIELLGKELERMSRIAQHEHTGRPADLKENDGRRSRKGRKPPAKNTFTEAQIQELESIFWNEAYPHQTLWHQAIGERTRNILKARQIGATFAIARERFVLRALKSGIDQNFLSASKRQALRFKHDIKQLAERVDQTLSGDDIVIGNTGATLRFLGTSARTAQSYSGDLIFDEYFWVYRFSELRKVASAMASHKHLTRTYISTPSAVAHEAYPFWTGEWYNKNREKADQVKLDLSPPKLRTGRLGADGQWRCLIDVYEAQRTGFDLIDIEQLKTDYSPDEFNNLYACQFVDDAISAFRFSDLQKCAVDSLEVWRDIDYDAPRPLGETPVRVGFDPSRSPTGDGASVTVTAPPSKKHGKYRVIDRIKMRGLTADQMADRIEQAILHRYHVEHVEIDGNGMGIVVADALRRKYPPLQVIIYTPEIKTRMVAKLQSLISKQALEYDTGDSELVSALLSIKRTITDGGGAITYKTARSETVGHADAAWSLMHSIGEPYVHDPQQNSASLLMIS